MGVLALMAATLTPLALVSVALAAPGDLDPSFGSAGVVRTPIGSGSAFALALALQPTGEIVAAGRSDSPGFCPTLTRYLSTGDLDPSFGSAGIVRTCIVGSSGVPANAFNALLLQLDGNIVAGGVSSAGQRVFTLALYLPTGDLDPSFGPAATGIVQTPIGSDAAINALALQPTGEIVAGGLSTSGGQDVFTLARYRPTGDLDQSFGSAGIVQTPIGSGSAFVSALILQPTGEIIAGGWSARGDQRVFTLARYLPTGDLDPSFGSAGIVQTSIGCGCCLSFFDLAFALVLQPDGNILAGGQSQLSTGRDVFTLARFLPTGDLDPSFGSAGVVQTPVGVGDDFVSALVRQPDGNIVAGGVSSNDLGVKVFTLARFLPGGDLDTSFGSAGIVQTPIGGAFDESLISALALQPTGEIVAGGWSFFVSGGTGRYVFTLARYIGG